MSAIRLATAGNVRGFQTLSSALNDSDGKWAHLIDYEGLQDEIGRFRVWSGNLGALQKGHSSLDYRLRDSPLLSSNALKFLKDLEDNINEAIAIVTEARLPYELQPKPEKSEDEDEDDDGFFDEDEDEDEDDNDGEPRSELSMRFVEVVDIVDNLYKLSVRIRTPTIRSRSLKAATYQPKDPDTGVDILSTYAIYDVQHVKELLAHLRQVHVHDAQSTEHDYVINRLSAAITLRRRQFKYWKRHRDKLGSSSLQEEQMPVKQPPADRPSLPQRNDTLEALPDVPMVTIDKEAPSQKTGRTLLSGTEATQHHQSLDEIVDTKSVTSYAVTVKDLHGRGVELPPPPRAADGEKDFECPYCYIICPARYGRGRAWRTHLLQDLQPYVCTYPECEGSEQLFRSRREWAEHEASHRKAWRCPEHTGAVYKSNAALEEHFRREHADSIPESQLSAIVKVGETTTVDVRTQCPICLAPADTEGLGDFHNHIANHLERIATFALPNGNEDESDGASSAASRGHSESSQSRNLSDLSLPTDVSEDIATTIEQNTTQEEDVLNHTSHHTKDVPLQPTGGTLLSAESLEQLPDASDTRLETLFAGRTIKADNSIEALDSDTDDSVYLSSDPEDEMEGENATYLQLSDIPTLRSLYRSRRLLQRDQSFNPNDSYNQVISLCHHDLTKMKVDAIVNGANRAMKFTIGETLNNAIHQAAGPGLSRETKTKGRLKKEAILTGGHRLPSKHIIHVLRPGYSNKSGMGQFNQLVDCYRNALDMATELELKTLAFPCLGTGGVGFPARVAARIVLQDVREYLDQHPEHGFERIVFCVNSAADEMAYIDFLPVFFPPTHGDLEAARSSVWSGDRATAALDALKARNEIQKVVWDLNLGFGNSVPSFRDDIISPFHAIDQALVSIRQYLLSSNEINNDLKDLRLLCSVMQLICGSVAETIELANDHLNLGQQNDLSIWADFVATMEDMHRKGPSSLLRACATFAQNLDTMITKNGISVDESSDSTKLRQILDRYKVKQRGGREADGTQDHLNEVLYTREFQRQTIAQSREHIKLHKIPTVTQLYKLGELDEKTTLARPSIEFNDKVCLVREDITRLEVDVMVNSADEAFEGIGALARTVFLKGGVELQEAVQTFGKCEAGDVRLTPGYLLPAKNILHVIPPDQLRQDTKDIMRKIYREVLYRAVTLGAASIALPSIGTGLLNFPRRDCVSIALEETKRFLESSIPGSLIEKIVFVVYSSNDEFVYKSLLPVYFPPPDLNVNRALPASIPRQDTAATTSSTGSDTPRRNLFGSIGEAFRSLRPGKPSGASRPISGNEEHALINFESHAKDCETCGDVKRLYLEGRDLCKRGDELAKIILWHMTMHLDSEVYAFPPVQGVSTRIEVPTDMFPISLELLATVEKSQRDGDGSRPFVARDRPYGATSRDQGQDIVPPGVTIHSGEVQIPNEPEPKKARARVSIMNLSGQWDPALSTECQILVRTNSVDVFENDPEGGDRVPLMSHVFTSQSKVQRRKTTPEVELYGCPRLESRTYTAEAVLFKCRSDNECNALLRSIRKALDDFQSATSSDEQQQTPGPAGVTEQDTSGEYLGWNKRLKDIQNELSTMKRASGGLSDLQYKMERLGIATSSLNPGSQQDTDASRLYDTSRSPLATSILVLLTADLKSRPGSYIGLETDRIVAELPATHDEVSSALQELVEQDQIHNTVDRDTWVISRPPKDLPVLSEGQYDQGQASREASPPGARAELGSSAARAEVSSSSVDNSKLDETTGSVLDSQVDQQNIPPYYVLQTKEDGSEELVSAEPSQGPLLSATTAKVFTYLMHHNHESSDHAYSNHEIAAAVDLTTEEVNRCLLELQRLSIVHFNREDKTCTVVGGEAQKEFWKRLIGPAEAVEERSAPSLNLIQPSPTASDDGKQDEGDDTTPNIAHRTETSDVGDVPSLNLIQPSPPTSDDGRENNDDEEASASSGIERFPDSAYETSPSGTIWTRIDKALAYSKVLITAGEVFDDMGDYWLVHREVSKQDVDQWLATGRAMLPSKRIEWGKEQSKGEFQALRRTVDEVARDNEGTDKDQKQGDIVIRNASETSDGLPSPTVPPPSSLSNDEIRRLGADRLPDSDYFISLSGQAWTRVKKRHVASHILVSANETFDDAGAHYLVYRAVGKSELMQWVLDTHRLEGHEKEKWEKEQRPETTYEEDLPPAVTRWSLLAENADILRLGDDRLHYSDYYISPSDMIWTRVEKSRVYSGTLVAANEEFSDNGSEFLVHRIAGKAELQRWAEETYSMAQADKDKWEEERKKAQEEKERTEPKEEEHTEPVSQFAENDEIIRLGEDRLSDSDYYIVPTGLLWTRVKKIYVYSEVLKAAKEDFSDSGSEFLVHRAAGKSDMQRWTENTQSMPQSEQEKWEEEQRQAREAMQMATGELYESFRKAWDVHRDGEQGADAASELQNQPEDGTTANPRLKVQEDEDVTVRPASEFGDLPPSPTDPSSSAQDDQLHLDTRTLNEKTFSYASPSGARWTRVDKRLIDPRVLIASDEDFEDVGDGLVVHRVLRRGEVDRWAQESIRTRATDTDPHGADYDSDWRQARAILGARRLAPSSDTVPSRGRGLVDDESGMLGERDGGPQKCEGDVVESPSVRQLDKGKGKERANEREKDDRDEYQEKLDRVIAGDMREEEMRRFGDGDEERYI